MILEKRYLLLIVSTTLLASSIMSVSYVYAKDMAVQSEGVFSQGVCGENISYKLTFDGTLTLSGSGPMNTYEYDSKWGQPTCGWGDDISKIKKIVIEDGITSISQYSFYDCENLTEVNIPSSVQSIGKDAFHWCRNITKVSIDNLESWCQIDFENNNSNPIQFGSDLYIAGLKTMQIQIPDGITEMKPYVFGRAYTIADDETAITSIQLPDTVTKIGKNAFCYNHLQSIKIPDSVTCIGEEAFAGNNFTTIEIPGNMTKIDNGAFVKCGELTTIELPDSVNEIGKNLFSGCKKLTTVKLSQNIDAIKSGMFEGCQALIECIIPDNVKTIEASAFSNCSSLQTIQLPENVKTIGESAFYNCSALNDVKLPVGLREMADGLFYGCTSLSEIEISDSVTSIGENEFYNCSSLMNIEIPDSVTSIGKNAFTNCSALEQILIPKGLSEIKDNTFAGCTELKKVNISENTVKIGADAFAQCQKLEQIVIPDNMETIGSGAFSGCEKVESITIPGKVQKIADSTFENCKNVKEIKLSDSIKIIGKSSFKNCSSLTQITIPANVTELSNYVFEKCSALERVDFKGDAPQIGDYAFNGITTTCYYPAGNETYTAKITTADFGGNLKWTYEGEEEQDKSKCGLNLTWSLTGEGKLIILGSGAMYDYSVTDYKYAPWYEQKTLIKSIEIDDRVTHIGDYAFYECNAITDVETTLPSKLQTIGEGAFKGSSVKSVKIPEGVTSAGKEAFSNTRVTKVVLPSSLIELSKGMFSDSHYLLDVTFSKGLQVIGDSAFSGCYGLNSVEIPEGVTSIEDYAFYACGAYKTYGSYYSCRNFTSVKLPETLKTLGKGAFYKCQILNSINIPHSITELNAYTLGQCTSLSQITIPKGIKKIDNDTFEGDSFKECTFSWNAPEIGTKAFSGITATCYYPSNNSAWTSSMLQNYGGHLTWIAKEMEKPSGWQGSDKEDSKGDNTGDNKGDNTGDNKGDNTGGNTGSGSSESEDKNPLGFTAHSLTLNGEIGVNFYLELNDTITEDSTAVMELMVGGKNLTIINVSDAVAAGTTSVVDSKGVSHNCYKFSCKVNAKQMTDTITATLKTKSGTWKESYSVQQYANEAKNTDNQKLLSVVNSMLTYGAYAQQLFNYNIGNLAGGSLGDVSSVTVKDLADYGYQKSGTEKNLSLYGSSLLLKDKTTIRVYYKLKSGVVSDYEFTVDGQMVTPKKSGDDLYYIEVKDIAAQDLDKVHTFTGGNSKIDNYSALSYAKTVLEYEKATIENKNTMSALYLYWQAAKQYFN